MPSPSRRSNRERPVKINTTFPEAIRFFATPPAERARRKGSQVAESGNTTSIAPGPDPAEPQNEYHPSLFDFLPENQTHADTSGDSEG